MSTVLQAFRAFIHERLKVLNLEIELVLSERGRAVFPNPVGCRSHVDNIEFPVVMLKAKSKLLQRIINDFHLRSWDREVYIVKLESVESVCYFGRRPFG